MPKSKSVDLLPISDGNWQEGPNLPWNTMFPKVAELNSDIYLLNDDCGQLVHLDVDSSIWRERAPLPLYHANGPHCVGVSMASARGRLYVAEGYANICAWYSPATDAWCRAQPTLRKHLHGALAYHDNKLLLLGGSFYDGTDEIEEYCFKTGTWSVCSYKMPARLLNHFGIVTKVHCSD